MITQRDITNYPYIIAWGRMMKSEESYIERQLELATNEKAPKEAIYKKDDKWELINEEIKKRLDEVLVP